MWWYNSPCVTSVLWSHCRARGWLSSVRLDLLHPGICQTSVDILWGWSTVPRQAWACINRCLRLMAKIFPLHFFHSLSPLNFHVESVANPSLSFNLQRLIMPGSLNMRSICCFCFCFVTIMFICQCLYISCTIKGLCSSYTLKNEPPVWQIYNVYIITTMPLGHFVLVLIHFQANINPHAHLAKANAEISQTNTPPRLMMAVRFSSHHTAGCTDAQITWWTDSRYIFSLCLLSGEQTLLKCEVAVDAPRLRHFTFKLVWAKLAGIRPSLLAQTVYRLVYQVLWFLKDYLVLL